MEVKGVKRRSIWDFLAIYTQARAINLTECQGFKGRGTLKRKLGPNDSSFSWYFLVFSDLWIHPTLQGERRQWKKNPLASTRKKNNKKSSWQLLVCGIFDLWRFWIVWNWSWGITWTHAKSVWNHWGPSKGPYSANLSVTFFAVSNSKPTLRLKLVFIFLLNSLKDKM